MFLPIHNYVWPKQNKIKQQCTDSRSKKLSLSLSISIKKQQDFVLYPADETVGFFGVCVVDLNLGIIWHRNTPKIMNLATDERKHIAKRLRPFLTSVTLYFVLLIPYESASIFAVIIKCIPILSLMYFVVSLGKWSPYSWRIVAGLLCCCIGDAFLLWNKYFVYGMVAFMFGHINYILAFGFRPIKLKIGLVLVLLGGAVISVFSKNLSGVLLIGVPIYTLVIIVMVWRALARTQKPWKWFEVSACVGSIFFAISDAIIGIDKFVRPVAHSQVLIMSSYYAAQLGISLSILEARERIRHQGS